MAADDADDDVGEVGLGVEVVQLAGLDERGDDGPVLGAEAYLADMITRIVQGHPMSRLDELLPWSRTPAATDVA